jgi:hypothetical protein
MTTTISLFQAVEIGDAALVRKLLKENEDFDVNQSGYVCLRISFIIQPECLNSRKGTQFLLSQYIWDTMMSALPLLKRGVISIARTGYHSTSFKSHKQY